MCHLQILDPSKVKSVDGPVGITLAANMKLLSS